MENILQTGQGLSFETLDAIQQLRLEILPLVLHGGTGIPDDMIKKGNFSLGVAKINVNTECQLSIRRKLHVNTLRQERTWKEKDYDPRKLLKPGADAIIETVKEKMELFGSVGKAE